VGRGTTFTVWLPADETTQAQNDATGSRPAAAIDGKWKHPARRRRDGRSHSIKKVLERSGYRVIEGGSGADVLGLWAAHRDDVSVLITDLVMPGGMSGYQLAQQLQEERPDLKVIYMSGYSNEAAGRGERGEHFLQKPFAAEQLLQALKRALRE
jgi:two-component system, cell cycle sensor histidine kinase and response regulator CckA